MDVDRDQPAPRRLRRLGDRAKGNQHVVLRQRQRAALLALCRDEFLHGQAAGRCVDRAFQVQQPVHPRAVADPQACEKMLALGHAAIVTDPAAGVENAGSLVDHRGGENPPMDVGQVAVDGARSDDRPPQIRRPDLLAGRRIERIDPVAHGGLEDEIAGLAIMRMHPADRERLRLEPGIVGNRKAEELDDALGADGGRRQHRLGIVRTGPGEIVAAGRDRGGHGQAPQASRLPAAIRQAAASGRASREPASPPVQHDGPAGKTEPGHDRTRQRRNDRRPGRARHEVVDRQQRRQHVKPARRVREALRDRMAHEKRRATRYQQDRGKPARERHADAERRAKPVTEAEHQSKRQRVAPWNDE